MSSHQRRRHGQSPPTPDPDRRYLSSTYGKVDEYGEIESIQRQAAALNARIISLTMSARHSNHSDKQVKTQRPNIVSRTSSDSTSYRKKRNPVKEGSNHKYYAVQNGINGNKVYSSWNEVVPYCCDHNTQYFYKGTVCKGFPMCTQAWD